MTDRVNERGETGFWLFDLVRDFVDWAVENPDKTIPLGILVTSVGIGIILVGASNQRRLPE